jgi:hypothetical protein
MPQLSGNEPILGLNKTSRRKTLAPQGPLQHATRATVAQSASKSIHEVG